MMKILNFFIQKIVDVFHLKLFKDFKSLFFILFFIVHLLKNLRFQQINIYIKKNSNKHIMEKIYKDRVILNIEKIICIGESIMKKKLPTTKVKVLTRCFEPKNEMIYKLNVQKKVKHYPNK